MSPIDDDDYLAEDFVTLSGWGIKYDPTHRKYDPTKALKLNTLKVNPRSVCDELFSEKKLRELNIPVFRLKQQLPYGINRDWIKCRVPFFWRTFLFNCVHM